MLLHSQMEKDSIPPAGEMEDEETECPVTAATGFVSGNETGYNYSEYDVMHSEGVIGLSTSGW